MIFIISSFICGIIFSYGLSVSGMLVPENIINFLDIKGSWDSRLLWVMLGAAIVYCIANLIRHILVRPVLQSDWHVPTSKKIEKSVLLGSALFGIGWGISGLCPGASIALIFSFNQDILIFLFALIVGMKIYSLLFEHS